MNTKILPSIALAISAGIVLGQAAEAAPLPIILPPYLQNPTSNAITVCFLAQKAEAVQIAWGTNGQASMAATAAASTAIPGTPWTIWKARLETLTPGSALQYQVRYELSGAKAETPLYHFRALDPEARSVRFLQFNDIHNNDATMAALMKWVKPDDYEFSLLVGDMWTNPDAAKNADRVFRTLAAYIPLLHASEKPFFLIRGNHETIGSFSDKMALLFDLPNLDAASKHIDQNWYFTLKAGPVWFLALDGGDDFIKRYDFFQVVRQRQADWMKTLIDKKTGDNAPWRVLVTHMPLYNTNIWNSEPCRQLWEPILKNTRIDFELSGHDHTWKRIDKGQTANIVFDGHFPDQQDPQNRKSYSLTALFPVLIGGGPSIEEASVAMVTADEKSVLVRHIAATDGRVQMEFKQEKPTGK